MLQLNLAANSLIQTDTQLACFGEKGTINIATSVLEKETIECLKDHFQSIGKEYINIAPLLIVPEPSNLREKSDGEEIQTFLDTMQAQFDVRSVVYISFGTFFWPEITSVSAVIEEFLEEQMPFLLAHPVAELPEELAGQISRSGIAKEVTWAPQQQVLAHSATGWFVTHGGWNSMQEAFRYRVPLIHWPIAAEQPLNAALLSLKFNAVFEVRRGERGTKKPYRCGDGPSPAFTDHSLRKELRALLQSLKGDEARRVRGNFEIIADRLASVWEDGGEAQKAFEGFLNRHFT
ncbi:hypothetical protein VNI00_015769 [Paramarasmius palmivorus]|uniref:UDP-Glycosyltransferase/glycogen phosphorylase n=1 Tax=Paramarasmius palmivorus TaxID=297713 RepID=A0AAW0BHY8_9AGAR